MPTPQPHAPPTRLAETFAVRLVSTQALTSRVRGLTFERVDGRPFLYEAGQWVSLVLPLHDAGGAPVRRAYSIASACNGGPLFELAVTRVDDGPSSSFLHGVEVGCQLEAKGPQGTFTRPFGAPALFVATGSGVAPFRAMVQAAIAAQQVDPLWVLLGVRTLDDALYADELRALCGQHPFVRLELCLSRPHAEWGGRRGYVQEHVALLWQELGRASGTPPHAWVCGLQKMVNEVRRVLREDLAVERQRVHSESYD